LGVDEIVSDDQIAELMFHSGLSTAGQVSMVSGRSAQQPDRDRR